MKNKYSFLTALWLVLLCAVLGFFLLAATDKDSRESEAENRMLAAFPKLTLSSVADASFMSGVESFLSDAFFARNEITSFTDRLTGAFSVMSVEDKAILAQKEMEEKLMNEGAGGEEAAEADPAMEEDAAEEEDLEDLVMDNGEVINASKSYLWLKRVDGTNNTIYSYSVKDINTYAETLRIMLNYLPEDGQICFAQVPLASIATRWTTQREAYAGWGSSVETMLEAATAGENRIRVFNAMGILEPYMAAGEELFYHSDHHWNAKGAYYVATEMMRAQGLPTLPYEEYDYREYSTAPNEDGYRDNFDALYPLLPTQSQVLTARTQIQELPLMSYESTTYRVFMNNSRRPWRRVITGLNNGRKALVICDSYGNAFAPYLLAYYDEVHMVDFRKNYYNKAQAGGSIGENMRYFGIDDVYIITSTANGLRKENSTVYLRNYLVN